MQPFQEDDEMGEEGMELADQDVFELEVPAASLICLRGLRQIQTKISGK